MHEDILRALGYHDHESEATHDVDSALKFDNQSLYFEDWVDESHADDEGYASDIKLNNVDEVVEETENERDVLAHRARIKDILSFEF